MRILVTGGAGFIGSHVVKILEAQGAQVIALDDFSSANFRNLDGTKAEVICADVTDSAGIGKLPKVNAVIHEAAITDTTFQDDKKMIMVNFEGFKNVFNFCVAKKAKLVYISSAATYGDGPSPMKETQSPHPLNAYAYSKYLCDCFAAKVMNKKVLPRIVGIRYFNVYGPGEYHKKAAASMIYQLYLQMAKGLRPRVFKYGDQKRDFIYVKDAARITVEALNLTKDTVINVGTGKAGSFNDIIAGLNKALGTKLEPDYFENPYKGAYQDCTEADTGLLKNFKLGAKFSLENGIADYVMKYLLSGMA
ncbi:MAG: ADP-glyceromanno-heptose 6-epimerase [Candidatus Omnitrophota bacterium]|nr:ADP-glyceromanno-heptose 6-epimerase [Candidatus Omnitrophota bacterium]